MPTRTAYNNALEQLNPEQRLAVESIEGPVLVLAGPGTGKTQILATRIGYILQHTDAEPHELLCLTYTEAGVIAMRNRLQKLIGPQAFNIPIHTFHGFCNSIIQENREYFGFLYDIQPVDDLERIQILRRIIDELPHDHMLKRLKGQIYYDLKGYKDLFSEMKKEGLSPQDLVSLCEQRKEELKDDPKLIYTRKQGDFKKGDLKIDAYNKLAQGLDRTSAAALLFPRYNQLLREYGRYDYHDMILFVIDALKSNQDLLLDYQERYQYVLVDEYQDTNGAQNHLLDILMSYWDRPNIFVVGDDDQAIFRFQGANLSGILEFQQRYHPRIIVLSNNYRSSQPILDASASLIQYNEERLVNKLEGLTKELDAAGKNNQLTIEPRINVLDTSIQEAHYIVEELRRIRKEGKVPLSKIAVLYKSHADADDIIDILEKENFPVNIRRKADVLLDSVGISIRKLMQIVDSAYHGNGPEDEVLSSILFMPFISIPKSDVSKVLYRYGHKRDYPNIKAKNLREFLTEAIDIEDLHLQDPQSFLDFSATLDGALEQRAIATAQVTFQYVLSSFGILDWLFTQRDRSWHLQMVNTLFDYIKDRTASQPTIHFTELLEQWDMMYEEGVRLPMNKILQQKDAVNFITCHSAKGLEFEIVYIIGLNAKQWEAKRATGPKFKFPHEVNEKDTEKALKLQDNRRLLYVAMTRAEQKLYLSYVNRDNSGKEIIKSQFVGELEEAGKVQTQEETNIGTSENSDLLIQDIHAHLTYRKNFVEGYLDHDLIEQALQGYSMSVTSLNKYLRCPIAFYFENILRVPSARTTYLGFGNAVHATLQDLVEEYRSYDIDLSVGKIKSVYQYHLNRFASHFTEKQFEDHLIEGHHILMEYIEYYHHQWKEPDTIHFELPIDNVQVQGVPITGKLDKVECYGKDVIVVDYKTGKYSSKKMKSFDPTNGEIGGDYWRQLIFYKLLIDQYPRQSWNFLEGVMDFVEKDNNKKFVRKKLIVTPEMEAVVTDQLVDSYTRINNHEFEKGCEEPHCTWCRMIDKQSGFSEAIDDMSEDQAE